MERKKNGVLLHAAAAEGFEAILTRDRNLSHQQNIARTRLAVVVLDVPRQRFEHYRPLLPELHGVLERIEPGRTYRVSAAEPE